MTMLSKSTVALFFLLATATLTAQEPPAMPMPAAEHAWLEKFVGEWVTKSEAKMGPDQPPLQCSGTLSSRMLGGFWVLNEMKGDMAGEPMTGVQTIGYDEAKKKICRNLGRLDDRFHVALRRNSGCVR